MALNTEEVKFSRWRSSQLDEFITCKICLIPNNHAVFIVYLRFIMGINCFVPNCLSVNDKQKHLKFHSFPRDRSLCEKWVRAIKTRKVPSQYARVCSMHFKKNDYTLTSMGQWKLLKKDAVPTENLPVDGYEQQMPRTRRLMVSMKNRENQTNPVEEVYIKQEEEEDYINEENVQDENPIEVMQVPKKLKLTSTAFILNDHIQTPTSHIPLDPQLAKQIEDLKKFNASLRKQIEDNTQLSNKLGVENRQVEQYLNKTKAVNLKLRVQNNELRDTFLVQYKNNREICSDLSRRLTQELCSRKTQLNIYMGIESSGYSKIFKKIFTDAQTKCLQGIDNLRWSKFDVTRARMLAGVSREAFDYLREAYKYPLPNPDPKW